MRWLKFSSSASTANVTAARVVVPVSITDNLRNYKRQGHYHRDDRHVQHQQKHQQRTRTCSKSERTSGKGCYPFFRLRYVIVGGCLMIAMYKEFETLVRVSLVLTIITVDNVVQNTSSSTTTTTSNNNNNNNNNIKNSLDEDPTTSSLLPLLNVPFYIYDNLGLPQDLTFDGHPYTRPTFIKHADDIYMIQAALQHPMRTMDPLKAKLFFVAAPINAAITAYDERDPVGTGQLCYAPLSPHRPHVGNDDDSAAAGAAIATRSSNSSHQEEYCNLELLQYIDKTLGESPWFQRYGGRDHIAITSYCSWIRRDGVFDDRTGHFLIRMPNVGQCNRIDFEGLSREESPNRVVFPSFYVGIRCAAEAVKTQDFAMVARLNTPHGHGNVNYQDRRNICDWIQEPKATIADFHNVTIARKPFTYGVCGHGQQCPALSRAKFGFHPRGDTWGANRLMDTLLSETVPIITRKEQYDTFPSWIDWDMISYYVEPTDRESFRTNLDRILREESVYEAKLQSVRQNRLLFDYETMIPLDVYMYMFQATIFPETRRHDLDSHQHRFPALKLPQPTTNSTSTSNNNHQDVQEETFLHLL